MRIESGGNRRAVSPAGAMGLMQLMPETWATFRIRYHLGRDPFDPHDNIFAAAAFLRELRDRYGSPGFLAAYNAGPARYEVYRDRHRPLPAETVAYVKALAPARARPSSSHDPRSPKLLKVHRLGDGLWALARSSPCATCPGSRRVPTVCSFQPRLRGGSHDCTENLRTDCQAWRFNLRICCRRRV